MIRQVIDTQFKIGITNAADASTDLTLFNRLYPLCNIIITRDLRNPQFQTLLLQHANKIILHCVVSGFGGTPIEPNAPHPRQMFSLINHLITMGFPVSRMVLKIDPIIPNDEGLKAFELVLQSFYKLGIKRCRYEIFKIPNYNLTRASLNQVFMYMQNPYYNTIENKLYYSANTNQRSLINQIINRYMHLYTFEACDKNQFFITDHRKACISFTDLQVMGINNMMFTPAPERRGCICPANKSELMIHTAKNTQCQLKCVHCTKQTSNI